MVHIGLDDAVARERDGWDALCGSRGGAFYGEAMTDDGLMVLVDGSVLDRDAVVASLDDAPPWDTYALHDPRLLRPGQDVVTLVYRAVARRAGAPPFEATMTSTYRLVDGALRLVLYQQTATAT
ncbi:nuclear transport factor 2 family protein [Cellulosimicrobium marinum]|uniref:nuclear transport factor 2 family protein n=1 Tax=Cellulosimicrobium marinum TaxID=1638992 RepID=UPI001E3B49F8|nr:nuclear transport factor 2 family protein [Cellulosimicrobium marinum]MCB7134993.1 nuclear transport factor 2 family protein [Cellulosimicrobium marinum]